MIYPDDPEKQAYETMAFSMESDKHLCIGKGYKTEKDAIDGHQELIEKFKTGNYKLVPVKWIIEFEDVKPKNKVGNRWGKRKKEFKTNEGRDS